MPEENEATTEENKGADEENTTFKILKTLTEQNSKMLESLNKAREELKSAYQDKYFRGNSSGQQDDFDSFCSERFDYVNKKKGE